MSLALRSKLFVPGSRPELFAKAFGSAADALSFDLEDSVAETHKAQARTTVHAALQSDTAKASSKTRIVRVNALTSPHFEADLHAVAVPGVHLINLPKPTSAQEVCQVAEALACAEAANGVKHPIGLLLNIESSKALRLAHELAAAHPRVMGLQLGLGDLFEPLAISRADTHAVQQAMFALRMAAGEAGVVALDSAFADVKDAQGYRAEAELARRMGFVGKSCIHPSQVELANEVFRPTDAEISHALAVVAAAAEARTLGRGACTVQGKMVDGPYERRAHDIIVAATRLGLLPG